MLLAESKKNVQILVGAARQVWFNYPVKSGYCEAVQIPKKIASWLVNRGPAYQRVQIENFHLLIGDLETVKP